MKLDLGSGPNPPEGYLGVDRRLNIASSQVMLFDLTSGERWPWDDDSIAALRSCHMIEHIQADEVAVQPSGVLVEAFRRLNEAEARCKSTGFPDWTSRVSSLERRRNSRTMTSKASHERAALPVPPYTTTSDDCAAPYRCAQSASQTSILIGWHVSIPQNRHRLGTGTLIGRPPGYANRTETSRLPIMAFAANGSM